MLQAYIFVLERRSCLQALALARRGRRAPSAAQPCGRAADAAAGAGGARPGLAPARVPGPSPGHLLRPAAGSCGNRAAPDRPARCFCCPGVLLLLRGRHRAWRRGSSAGQPRTRPAPHLLQVRGALLLLLPAPGTGLGPPPVWVPRRRRARGPAGLTHLSETSSCAPPPPALLAVRTCSLHLHVTVNAQGKYTVHGSKRDGGLEQPTIRRNGAAGARHGCEGRCRHAGGVGEPRPAGRLVAAGPVRHFRHPDRASFIHTRL